MKMVVVLLPLFICLSNTVMAAEADYNCISLKTAEETAKAMGINQLATLTHDQWEFARGVQAGRPDTPNGPPPGDHAVFGINNSGEGIIFFVDDGQYCESLSLGPVESEIILSVGIGDIIHPGKPL
jgi:hypothetical protein